MLRIIGDVHGDIARYVALVGETPCSVALGDIGFRRSYEEVEAAGLDPQRHRILQGNHDWYTTTPPGRVLGDFGTCTVCGVAFFFVRGARSIDRAVRTEGVDWFREEELPYARMQEAIDRYVTERPHLVLSHEAPSRVVDALYPHRPHRRSTTSYGLQAMLEQHEPEAWLFGHHHRSWRSRIGKTLFVCLNELEVLDLDGPVVGDA